MILRYASIVIFGFLVLLGCNTEPTDNSDEILHPTEINKIPLKAIDYNITNERSEFWFDSTDLELVTSIGIAAGEKEYMIGQITDLETRNNNVILLDGQSNHLRLFDAKTGNFLQQFGKAGSGPGDLMYPMDTAINDSLLFVSDRLLKTEIFKLSGGKYETYGQVPLDFSPSDICIIDNFLFLDGFSYKNNKKTVHKYDFITKEKLDSYHAPYKTDSQLAKMALSNNRVSCNSNSKTVIVASHYLPFIYGYDLDGNIKWVSKLDKYYYRRIVQSVNDEGRPSIAKGANRNGYTDHWGAFTPLGNSSYLIFQISRFEQSDGETIDTLLLTYILDTRDGSTNLISKSLPVIKSITGNKIISYTLKNNFPEIKIFNIRNENLRNFYR